MAWSTPRTWNNDLVTPSLLEDELSTNQIALKDPPSDNYEANEASDYSTSSSTYADVDSTNYSYSLTTTGGDVLLGFSGAAEGAYIDVLVDGTRIINNTDAGLVDATLEGSGGCFVHIVTGLSAGVHTFVLQFKTAVGSGTIFAGAGTASVDVHTQFFAREIS